jgi:hypothetical protein
MSEMSMVLDATAQLVSSRENCSSVNFVSVSMEAGRPEIGKKAAKPG